MIMKKYLEKFKSSDLSWLFWKTKGGGSVDSPESGWVDQSEKRRRAFSLSIWILIGLLLLAFLSVGIYFIVADVKILKSVVEKEVGTSEETDTSETSWWQTSDSLLRSPATHPSTDTVDTPEATIRQEEDPNLMVRFDYVDLSSEDIPTDERFIDNVLAPNDSTNARETIIILRNDDSGKKIFLRTSGRFPSQAEEEGEERVVKNETTTPKAFVYSPTIPQATPKKLRVDATTRKYNHSEASGCFSTKIPFCEGTLRYDVVQLPNFLGIKRYSDLSAFLPYFQMIVDSGCSPRAREFICSVLEPECQPEGLKQRLPCKLNCKVFSEDCKGYILETLPPSKIFDCQRYPDWDESQDCLNIFKGKCHEDEFKCSDGTCIPLKWVCDGVHDCPGSRPSFDESNCQGCSENEFRCVLDGKCVPLHWKCDGQTDCVDHSDEVSC